jgi:hypothetical protein
VLPFEQYAPTTKPAQRITPRGHQELTLECGAAKSTPPEGAAVVRISRHTLTMVNSSLPPRYSLSVYSALWPPLSIRMLPTIVRSGRLTETPDQLLVFSCGQNLWSRYCSLRLNVLPLAA